MYMYVACSSLSTLGREAVFDVGMKTFDVATESLPPKSTHAHSLTHSQCLDLLTQLIAPKPGSSDSVGYSIFAFFQHKTFAHCLSKATCIEP